MKITQKNAEGVDEEIEVLTQDEVNKKLEAEKATLEAAHKDELAKKETSISTLANEKKELEDKINKAELSGLKEDHPNFKILKEALTKKDEEIKKISTDLENDRKQRVTEEMDSKIKIASKGNDEMEKKIKYHLEKTLPGLPEGTAAERKIKLEAAIKLASDISSDGPGMFDAGIGGGGRGSPGGEGNPSGVEFSAKEKALGAKLGITAEDYKKYSGRVSKRN